MKDLYGKIQILEKQGEELDEISRLKAMNRPLLTWYGEHARQLPWRDNPTPYRVWISEIMLQQTRVEAVKPYFHRFMEALPELSLLAEVEEETLLKLWEGLGYYTRAKNLKKAAITAMETFGGQLPESYEDLLTLPGIGSYTAGAIASIAFGIPVAAVDGNVLRVISRLLESREDILKPSLKKSMEKKLTLTMPKDRASEFNQGLIEIGATVCIPNGQPKCGQCPVNAICLAGKHHTYGEIPVKTPKKKRRIEQKTVLLLEHGDHIAIIKRPESGLLASLYEFPNCEGWLEGGQLAEEFGLETETVIKIEPLEKAVHVFSHVEWHMTGYRVTLGKELPEMYLEVEKTSIREKYPLPNAFGAYIRLIK